MQIGFWNLMNGSGIPERHNIQETETPRLASIFFNYIILVILPSIKVNSVQGSYTSRRSICKKLTV